MKTKLTTASVTASVAAFPSTAAAADWEFHTYGGFVPVTDALRHVALVFSDPGYQGIFFSIAVLGMVVLWIGAMLKAGQAGKPGGLVAGWGIWTAFGLGLYLAFVVPKSDVMVYDTVKNRQEVISGVPSGLAAVLGTLNLVERAIVEIVDTAGFVPAGMEYSVQAGGVGFDLLLGLGREGVVIDDVYVRKSLDRYVDDCFEWGVDNQGLARSGYGAISINDVIRTPDLMEQLAKADYPGISTLYYDDLYPAGETTYCRDSWARLRAIMSSRAVWDAPLRSLCARSGFDPSIPAEFSRCREAVQSGSGFVAGGTGLAAENLVRQTFLAGAVDHVVRTYSPDDAIRALASKDIGMKMTSAFVSASEWLPVMRTTITAIVIALAPVLALLIPTGLAGRAAGMLFGFFFWLTAWGVGDAIAHSFAVQSALHAFEEVQRWGLGYRSIMFFETDALKTMAMFGKMRVMSAMLATVTTMAVLRFGGHAMAMFAGSISGDVFAGAGRADDAVTPEGAARMRGQAAESAGKLSSWEKIAKEEGIPEELTRVDPQTRFDYRAEAAEYGEAERLGYADERIGQAGGDPGAAAERDAEARSKGMEEKAGRSDMMSHEQAQEAGQAEGAKARAASDLLRMQAGIEPGTSTFDAKMKLAKAGREMGWSGVSLTGAARFGDKYLEGRFSKAFGPDGRPLVSAFTGVAGKEDLARLADWQASEGHENAADKLRAMSEELNPGDQVEIKATGDGAGGWATFEARHGGEVKRFDLAQDRDLTQSISGSEEIVKDTKLVDTTVTDRGGVEWSNLFQRAGAGDAGMYGHITGAKGAARAAMAWDFADRLANAMPVNWKGVDAEQWNAKVSGSARAGLEILGSGGGVGFEGGAMIESRMQQTSNVGTRALYNTLAGAYAEAGEQGLSPEDTNRYVADRVQDWRQGVLDEFQSEGYGPSDTLRKNVIDPATDKINNMLDGKESKRSEYNMDGNDMTDVMD
ncbi:MAG: conjugal transfer protein TraG N-terminal domain-containing protein [Candidatus Nitrospinota bacterium M3_3B_026]